MEYRLYDDGDKGTSVAHYKVIDGAHDWPGSWGNMDIHASSLIWEFVSQYDINGLRGGITTSTDHILAEEIKIWVYPNPSSDVITIKTHSTERQNYHLYSSIGKHIVSGAIGPNKGIIDLGNLPKGLYILEINDKVVKFLKAE